MSSKTLIIPAAGSGKRMRRKQAKPFIKLNGQAILAHTIGRFLKLSGLAEIVIATSAQYLEMAESILRDVVDDGVACYCVVGGEERQQSVRNALNEAGALDLVLVHDAVRPLVELSDIEHCCDEAEKTGAAVLGIPSKDTIKEVDKNHYVVRTPDRKKMWQVQTPQVFKTEIFKKAHTQAAEDHYFGTDDASLVEWLGEPVRMVRGNGRNIKITYPQDLERARILLDKEGYD